MFRIKKLSVEKLLNILSIQTDSILFNSDETNAKSRIEVILNIVAIENENLKLQSNSTIPHTKISVIMNGVKMRINDKLYGSSNNLVAAEDLIDLFEMSSDYLEHNTLDNLYYFDGEDMFKCWLKEFGNDFYKNSLVKPHFIKNDLQTNH